MPLNTLSPKSSASHASFHSFSPATSVPGTDSPSVIPSSRSISSRSRTSKIGAASQPPETFMPSASIPASLKEKSKSHKTLKIPIVSNVVDAIVERLKISISTLHLHEPNPTGFHVDLWLRILGTGPLKAKVSFPQGVSLIFALPTHDEFLKSAEEADYSKFDAQNPAHPPPPPTPNNGFSSSASLRSVSSNLPTSREPAARKGTAKGKRSATFKDGSSTAPLSGKKLHTSASTGDVASGSLRPRSVIQKGHGDRNGNGLGAHSDDTTPTDEALPPTSPKTGIGSTLPPHKNRVGGNGALDELGPGKVFCIHAHLEPVKLKPLPGDVPARIRIEASGPELENITALVNKVVRTHGEVRLVLQADGVVIKAYGIRFSAKRLQKDIIFEGLSHLTNVLRFERPHQTVGRSLYHAPSPPMPSSLLPSATARDDGYQRRLKDGRSNSLLSARAESFTSSRPRPEARHIHSEVQDLQILAGTPETGIEFSAKINLPNPANLIVDLTSLEFDLGVPSETVRNVIPALRMTDQPPSYIPIGFISLAPTRLAPGDNFIEARGRVVVPNPPPGTHPTSHLATIVLAGQYFLTGLLENRQMEVRVAAPGTTSISPVLDPMRPTVAASSQRQICALPWLATAIEGIVIDAVLPPLGERVRLLDGAEFRFEPLPQSSLTGPPVQRSVARTSLRQGLNVPIKIFSLKVDCIVDLPAFDQNGQPITANSAAGPPPPPQSPSNNRLGTGARPPESLCIAIVQSLPGSDVMVIEGTGQPSPQSFPVQLNPDLRVLIKIVRGHAAMRNVDLGRTLNAVLDTFATGVGSLPPKDALVGHDPWDDLPSLIARVVKNMKVRAILEVDAAFGDYRIPGVFRFQIRDLPIVISTQTAATLIPHISQPIVTDIIDRMTLHLDNFIVNELSVHGIHAQCDVRLLNFGPMRSEVRFREGLELKLLLDGRWTRCGTALIADMITVDPYAPEPVQSDVFVVPLAGQAGGEAFSKFVEALVQQQSFAVFLSANQLSIRTGGTNFVAPIHKAISLEGMNGLRGLTVENLEVLGEVPSPADAFRSSEQKDALRIKIRINIPNSSSINLGLARLTLYMMFEGVCVGDLEVDEVVIRGKHVTHADGLGTIYIGADDQHETRKVVVLEKIGKLFSLLIAGLPVDLEVRGRRTWAYAPGMGRPSIHAAVAAASAAAAAGTSSARTPTSPDGRGLASTAPPPGIIRQSQRIGWLDAAVRTINLPVKFGLPEPLMIVKQIEIGVVTAAFTDGRPPALAIKDITAVYELPYSVSFQVLGLALDLHLLYDNVELGSALTDESNAVDTEQWHFPRSANEPAGVAGKIQMNLSSFTLRDNVDTRALSEAIAIVADKEDATHLQVRGKARVRALTALGAVTADIQLGEEHIVSVKGLNGLRPEPLREENLVVAAASKDFILLRFDLLLYNPSPSVSIHVLNSGVSFAAFYKGFYVGRAIIKKDLILDIGHVRVEDTEFQYQPAAEVLKDVLDVPTNLMSGRMTELLIEGDEHSTTIDTLLPALKAIRVPFLLKPILNGTLIDSIATRLSVGMLTSQTCMVEFVVNNPLGVPIDILDLSFKAKHRGEDFATCSTSFRQTPDFANGIRATKLSVPPGTPSQPGQQTSPAVETRMAKRIDKIVTTLVAEKGLLYLDIELEARVELGSAPESAFPVFISYSQSGLPLKIRGLPGLG
ncbi:hypothetical protein OC846_000823 [Tilletia horrida]|uniref:Uncharacterized protein n=1 Tax=Tilletia horrida TaxID=155126 RepID=A0AAN6GV26_9BASI|nr:hypothetical protein OC845_002335 [Tilletia horrida]KAK0556978.1 hypothetical protein OC846_000823 [Tilletia horrida]KAK0566672.1 hypothetical protein OC861_003113 [Tilletia horrida]